MTDMVNKWFNGRALWNDLKFSGQETDESTLKLKIFQESNTIFHQIRNKWDDYKAVVVQSWFIK